MAELIREEYLSRLEAFRDRPDIVKIITGVRRSGKSTILDQFHRRLESQGEDVVHANLEDLAFVVDTDRELNSYIRERMGSKDSFVLLDEVQSVRGWEKVVNALRAGGANVYVTGSNARVLSSDFATIIGGRYVETHVTPFSFSEFLQRYPPHGDIRTQQRFDQYLVHGGIPMVDLDDDPGKNRAILEGVFDSIVSRDITARSGMEVQTVRRMTSFMYSNVGNLTTLETLMNGSGTGDRRTADRYLEAIADSYVFYKVNRYDLVGKRLMKVSAKYFASDTGLRNTAMGHTDDGASGLLENVVFLELKRRGYDVVVGSYRDYEVDFTVRRDGDVGFIQVAKTEADGGAAGREVRPLKLLKDGGAKTVLTMDRDLPDDSDGIHHMNLVDWLLEASRRVPSKPTKSRITRMCARMPSAVRCASRRVR